MTKKTLFVYKRNMPKIKIKRLDSRTLKAMYESKTVELAETQKLFSQTKREYEERIALYATELEDVKKYYQDLIDTMAGWSLLVIFLIKILW